MTACILRSTGFACCAVVAGAVFVAGCGLPVEGEYPYKQPGENPIYAKDEADLARKRGGSIFGEGGLTFFGRENTAPQEGGGIGVNSFLWRATLDTVSFLPVNSADPFGGVIITDWHSPAQTPTERFKLNVYIMGRALRADGVRVAVFRQVQDSEGGAWRDASIPEKTATSIENAILTKARRLRNEVLRR